MTRFLSRRRNRQRHLHHSRVTWYSEVLSKVSKRKLMHFFVTIYSLYRNQITFTYWLSINTHTCPCVFNFVFFKLLFLWRSRTSFSSTREITPKFKKNENEVRSSDTLEKKVLFSSIFEKNSKAHKNLGFMYMYIYMYADKYRGYLFQTCCKIFTMFSLFCLFFQENTLCLYVCILDNTGSIMTSTNHDKFRCSTPSQLFNDVRWSV